MAAPVGRTQVSVRMTGALRLKVQYKEREQYELKERVKMVKEFTDNTIFVIITCMLGGSQNGFRDPILGQENDKSQEMDGKGSKTRSLKACCAFHRSTSHGRFIMLHFSRCLCLFNDD